MLFHEAFKKLELDEVARILDEVAPHLQGVSFDPIETTIMALDLAFYPGCRLLDIADFTAMPALHRYVVYRHGNPVVLDFTNVPIYALNANIPLMLNGQNVLDYARFFFTFVRGRHGRFQIVENVDDIQWKEDPPPPARKAIGKMLHPLQLLRQEEHSAEYHLKICMMFKDSLFTCDVFVHPQGRVTLKNEELLIEDMPVLDDTFGL